MESILNEALLQSVVFQVSEVSQVAAARRGCSEIAFKLGFSDTQAGRVAIVVTEAATNILKHGFGGEIIARAFSEQGLHGIEIIAIDSGPGMTNIGASLRDGVSTAGSPGTGLGAMQRLSSQFDIYSSADKGTAVCMVLWQNGDKAPTNAFRIGAVCLPLPSEEICGDAWACNVEGDVAKLIVADGLGHGPLAREASQPAIDVLDNPADEPPQMMLQTAHRALRGTRGAAVAIAVVDLIQRQLKFVGIGNIAAHLFADGTRRQIMSHNGIVGNNMRKVQEFVLEWTTDAMLVLHSDGLVSHWDIGQYPGLEHRHPALIAAILYRDFSRKRDDITVVVIQQAPL
jgi:anti-sigma regulatory factor (Ser/Thr protein kinase)